MAITIENLRIIPYTQKNGIKPIFGDVMSLTFTLPQPYSDGDEYILGLDYERVLIPTERPICALQDEFTVEQNNITFALAINTARFRDWVSTLKKPMPIWLQLARKRDGIWQTLLIDDVLAIPTIIDGSNLVFPGDPLDSRLDAKLDKPEAEGSAGQVLQLGEDGKPIWANGGGGGGSVNWDDIQGKPSFSTVAETGSYDDLTDKPTIPTVGAGVITIIQGGVSKGAFSVNQSSAASIELDAGGGDVNWTDIQGKPSFAAVAETGSYNDLTDKPTIPTVGAGVITIIQGGVSKGSFSVNQSSAASIELDAGGGSVEWNDIEGKPSFAAVAETGSYDDLTNKPTIPTDYIPTSAIGSAGGVASLNSSGLVPDGQITLERPIITIPTATTAYTFADGAVYQHTPSAAPTYTLPSVTDLNRTHTVIVNVQFSAVQTCIFTYGGSTVAPLDSLSIAAGDIVEYLCRFDPLQVKWVIACGKLNS